MSRRVLVAALLLSFEPALGSAGEAPLAMSLRQAEEYALGHHPGIRVAQLRSEADRQDIRSARAAYLPQIAGVAEAVDAGDSTRVAASGGLNNPTVFRRQSDGLLATQLITDFGRTSELTASARYRAEASEHEAEAATDRVLLDVDRAYFEALRAQALLRVADQTVAARSLIADRVAALAKAQLKSALDQSFAEVSLREATLLKLRSQDRLETAYASLATALGMPGQRTLALADEPLPPPPTDDVESLIRAALDAFPPLQAIRSARAAAEKSAEAIKAEEYPAVNAMGAVGFSPWRDDRLPRSYGAAAVTVTVPLFMGGRLQARAAAAALRVGAADSAVEQERNRVEHDVRVAWLDARTAFTAIDVTDRVLESARQAYDLAESRYNLGISSMVELSQAQLQRTEAEIVSATARYEYQVKSAELNFVVRRRRGSAANGG